MKKTEKKAPVKAAESKKSTAKATKTKVAAVKSTVVAKPKKVKVSNPPISHGVGRRKSCVARVWMRKGKGLLTINKRDFTDYFSTETERLTARIPLNICKEAASFDIDVNISGGGTTAQADAVKLGISRALVAFNESLRPLLREHNLLTVDSRVKERKKYGQKAARRKFQFVKR
jgi:small subunit ribosomal protein S9